jgi:hypothetical protein
MYFGKLTCRNSINWIVVFKSNLLHMNRVGIQEYTWQSYSGDSSGCQIVRGEPLTDTIRLINHFIHRLVNTITDIKSKAFYNERLRYAIRFSPNFVGCCVIESPDFFECIDCQSSITSHTILAETCKF